MTSDPQNIPVCDCHGVPKLWNKDARLRSGGFWFCRIKNNEANRLYREANPEKKREDNARRIKIGGMYLGMCGFTDTERRAMLNGPTE